MSFRFSIRGLQEAQAANLKMIAAVHPSGGLDAAVRLVATQAHRSSVYYTHVDTGALRASHRITREGAARYRVHIDPAATNPRSGARTSVYGPAEHERGTAHAFYRKTYERDGAAILSRAAVYLVGRMP